MKYIMFFLVFALLLCGCRRTGQADLILKEPPGISPTTEHQIPTTEDTIPSDPEHTQPNIKKAQLLCLVKSQEEADEIASLYGIELASFFEGLATYRTEEDPREVIQRGEEQGWPPLYLNYTAKLH